MSETLKPVLSKASAAFLISVKAFSEKTKRDQHWRSSEAVELWVLTHK